MKPFGTGRHRGRQSVPDDIDSVVCRERAARQAVVGHDVCPPVPRVLVYRVDVVIVVACANHAVQQQELVFPTQACPHRDFVKSLVVRDIRRTEGLGMGIWQIAPSLPESPVVRENTDTRDIVGRRRANIGSKRTEQLIGVGSDHVFSHAQRPPVTAVTVVECCLGEQAVRARAVLRIANHWQMPDIVCRPQCALRRTLRRARLEETFIPRSQRVRCLVFQRRFPLMHRRVAHRLCPVSLHIEVASDASQVNIAFPQAVLASEVACQEERTESRSCTVILVRHTPCIPLYVQCADTLRRSQVPQQPVRDEQAVIVGEDRMLLHQIPQLHPAGDIEVIELSVPDPLRPPALCRPAQHLLTVHCRPLFLTGQQVDDRRLSRVITCAVVGQRKMQWPAGWNDQPFSACLLIPVPQLCVLRTGANLVEASQAAIIGNERGKTPGRTPQSCRRAGPDQNDVSPRPVGIVNRLQQVAVSTREPTVNERVPFQVELPYELVVRQVAENDHVIAGGGCLKLLGIADHRRTDPGGCRDRVDDSLGVLGVIRIGSNHDPDLAQIRRQTEVLHLPDRGHSPGVNGMDRHPLDCRAPARD